MKKLFFLFVAALMAATTSYAQNSGLGLTQNSGLGFNYQAVVRNADGMLLANQDVNLRISLSWPVGHKPYLGGDAQGEDRRIGLLRNHRG